ncbi:MAG: DUF2145 domain-containing protein [Granulosicoccaceae bacterium]
MQSFLKRCVLVFAMVVAMVSATHAWAGSSQAAGSPALAAERVASFSKQVERELADSGARVAILARTGRPRSELPQGVRYTHVGLAVYSALTLDNGEVQPGYAIYNLYQQPHRQDRSQLVQDYPFDFFAPVPLLRAGVIVPTPELQQRLLQVITGPVYRRLHNNRYSVIANPHNNQRQNCTEFVLNVVQAALYARDDMAYIKHSLRDHFRPTKLNTSPLKLMAGAVFSEGISLRDQGAQVHTATFGSIADYFRRYGLEQEVMHLDEELQS